MKKKSLTDLIHINEVAPEHENRSHGQALADTGFWGNAGAGAIFMAKDTGRILLAHRSPHVEQPNTWGVWGGAIDKGENPLQAAHREAQEEAGYNASSKDIIPLYVFKHPSGFQYHNFLILVDHEFEPKSSAGAAWETQGHEWVQYGDWPTPLHFGVEGILKDPNSNKVVSELAKRFALESGQEDP